MKGNKKEVSVRANERKVRGELGSGGKKEGERGDKIGLYIYEMKCVRARISQYVFGNSLEHAGGQKWPAGSPDQVMGISFSLARVGQTGEIDGC